MAKKKPPVRKKCGKAEPESAELRVDSTQMHKNTLIKKSKCLAKLRITKSIEKAMKRQELEQEQKFFYLKSGRKLKSLYDLAKNMERMSDDVFSYHVTPYKNDFSAWIYHEFGEVELARMLANEKDKKRTLELLIQYFR